MDAAEKMRILDANLAYYGISVADAMENAGKGVASEIEKRFCRGKRKKIAVFCGLGNNGGDGLVCARYLAKKNSVHVFLAGRPELIKTPEAKLNWQRLKKTNAKVKCISSASEISAGKFDIVVEALVGLGVEGRLKEPLHSIVAKLNALHAGKVAVDVPAPGFKADLTVSLHNAKVNGAVVVGIGIPKELENFTGPGNVKILKRPAKNSHKGENGVVLLVAGSRKWHGAPVFAGLTASRLCDLVLFATARENIPIAKKASPEFIVFPLQSALKEINKADCVLIGPGLEPSASNKALIKKLLSHKDKKFVLDATALRLANPYWLNANCVVTPHRAEFKALFKAGPNEKNVKAMAKKFNCIVVLKGSVDLISDGRAVYKNFSGNQGMTKGGTGDVLAGLIAGFAATNDLLLSCLAAAFLNGFAGDLLKEERGFMFNAQDLMEMIPRAKKLLDEL
ncbi:MAG: NAD(P)H-hydrate dehydratase [Candidatus Diapherotrites archaeon]|nr:NAD(P)H-hydrate dehydratase [Candidatus Diapherotrites archaeon]